MTGHEHAVETEGRLIRWARGYDLLLKVASLGFESRIRGRIIAAGGLEPGRRVLDVGCGTGTLALAAAEAMAGRGVVSGIDPAPEMIARATAKAARRGIAASFKVGVIESLGFPDGSQDVVFSTIMYHHLTPALQAAGMKEIRRVLAPGGRLVLADFGSSGPASEEARRAGFASVRLEPMRPRFVFLMVAQPCS